MDPRTESILGHHGVFPQGMVWIACSLLSALLVMTTAQAGFADKTVRVGVYDNSPMISMSPQGPQGLFIDVLEHIADGQDWDLDYQYGSWEKVYKKLKSGTIDLLPVVAYMKARDQFIDYSQDTLLTNWGQVYTAESEKISSIQDLKGKRIGIQPLDTHGRHFAHLMKQMRIDFIRVPVADYLGIFQALDSGDIQAGVVNRIFAATHEQGFNIRSTPIVFNPIQIRYAVPKGDPANVLPALNHHLPKMINEPDSVYHESMDRWLEESDVETLPAWLFKALYLFVAMCIGAFVLIVWLRLQVRRRTRELSESNLRLQERETRYRKVVETAMDGFLLVDLQGAVQEANQAYADMSGYTEQELVGMRIEDLEAERNDDDLAKHINKVMDAGTERFESRHRRQDGTVFDVEVSSSFVPLGHGMFTAFIRDITERKQAEEVLRESEEQFRSLFEDNAVAMLLVDPVSGDILDANKAASSFYGWSRHELRTMRIFDINILPAEEVKKKLRAIQQQRRRHFDFKHRLADGQIRNVEVNSGPITIQGREILYSTIVDVTERKQAEKERDHLQTQLVQAQKMESVGRLAGGVAHDLNNMLVAILGYGEMLLANTDIKETYKRQIELMYQAGLRSRDLVRQLLAFSRKQTLKMERLDVNDMLEGFQKLLQKTIREDISVHFTLSPELPPILGDRSQLEQVVLNLAVNAQDAMPGGGSLSIETNVVELDEEYAAQHLEVSPGRYVQLMVSDTGHGIDEEIMEHIFEPFFTTKKLGEGTGLGLATVYGIIKQHRGDIWVYSESGQGTTFKIYLPVSDEAGEECRPPVQHEAKGDRGRETILVAEDNDMVRNLTVNVLQDLGYTVLFAPNGTKCLEILKSYTAPVDLLLTDVIMPDMNGKALFEEVITLHPEIKVLFMSGYADEVVTHHGVLEEGVAFIQKPFAVQELCRKVREVLNREEKTEGVRF